MDSGAKASFWKPRATLLVLICCSAATLLVWGNAKDAARQDATTHFRFRTQELEMAVQQRMLAYEQVLRGCAGLIGLLDFPSREKWHLYVDRLELDRNYPGIQGVGFSKRLRPEELNSHLQEMRKGFPGYTIRPLGERPEYTAIIYLEPFDWRNQRALGYDMFSETVRQAAMIRARDTGETALSGKVTLVQETDTDVQAGFLMYLPVYKKGAVIDSTEARRRELIGYAYSPFRARDLMRGLPGSERNDLDLEIFDGTEMAEKSLLYHYRGAQPRPRTVPLFSKTSSIVINGARWTLRFRSLPAFETVLDHRRPRVVLITGITITLLITGITWSLATTRELNRFLEQHVNERTADLNREVAERQRIEVEILQLNEHLERRVSERTAELEQAHRELLSASRQAGMAEVATSVLHNVGNVLNSVNVSSTLVADKLRKSKASGLAKLSTLLEEHAPDLATFFTQDARGKQIPTYLARLAEHLAAEQATLVEEADLMHKNIEHIRDIVAMQQSYGRLSGIIESVNLADLLEDSLRMNATALSRDALQVVREYEELPLIAVDKHKVLQILVNLIRNARDACDLAKRPDARLNLRILAHHDRVRIVVADNGIGIPQENLIKIFGHGFTTRKNGHGFGLHSGALAAKELGGSLTAESDGPGKGATFILELPVCPPSKRASQNGAGVG